MRKTLEDELYWIDCLMRLGVKLIVSAIEDYDLPFLRSTFAEELCSGVGLGVSAEEIADKLEAIGPINFQFRREAVIKALQDA